jgi:hypothetical protein
MTAEPHTTMIIAQNHIGGKVARLWISVFGFQLGGPSDHEPQASGVMMRTVEPTCTRVFLSLILALIY